MEWKLSGGHLWEIQPVRELQHLKARRCPKVPPRASLDPTLRLFCSGLAHAHPASANVCCGHGGSTLKLLGLVCPASLP